MSNERKVRITVELANPAECPFRAWSDDSVEAPTCLREHSRCADVYGKRGKAPDWCPLRTSTIVVQKETPEVP